MAEEKRKLPKGIRKRGNRYEGRIQYALKTYCVYGDTISETKKKMTELRYKLEHGFFVEKGKLGLNEWFETWLTEYKENEVKIGTVLSYRNFYNFYVKDDLGHMPVSSIRGEHIQKLYNKLLDETLAPSSLKILSAILSGCFKRALKNGLIEKNPVDLASLPRQKRHKERRVLTVEEQRIFMEYSNTSYLYNLFCLLLRTGMRSGEIRGLKFSDIDKEKRVIHVNRTLKYEVGRGFFEDSPKTATSLRTIPLTIDMEKIIERQKQQWYEEKVLQLDAYIFHLEDGTPISRERLQGEINRILKHAADDGYTIDRFTPHCLRHTFATRAIEAGMEPQVLKAILGHSTLSMTMDLYAHVMGDKKAEEMEKIAGSF